MAYKQWKISFWAANVSTDETEPSLDGVLSILAKDLFDALDIAKHKIKTFGFNSYEIRAVKRMDMESESETT